MRLKCATVASARVLRCRPSSLPRDVRESKEFVAADLASN